MSAEDDGGRRRPIYRFAAAVGGIGLLSIMLLLAAAVLLLVQPWDWWAPDAWADHRATQCIMVIRGELYPVTYLGEYRQNPDGTFYPGDAFYYLFTWQDRSLPDECGMRPPVLKTEGLQLNHTGVLMGAVDSLGGFKRAGTAFTHQPQDSVAVLGEYRSYFGVEYVEGCHVPFVKPGQSWDVSWVKYRLHGEPFLVKDDDSRLGNFELSKWNSKKRAAGATEYWVNMGKIVGQSKQPLCDFGLGGGEGKIPEYISFYGYAPSSSGTVSSSSNRIFVQDTYKWEYRQFANSTHPHRFDVLADPGSRDEFDARIAEACGSLGADSGCMYGTATITPHSESCLYAEIERILGDDWLAEPDKDNDGIRDADEGPEDDPPPPYLPPGIPVESYTPPSGDTCIPPDNVTLEAELKGHYWTAQHRVQAGIEYPIPGIKTVVADRSPPMPDPNLYVMLTKPPLHHADGGYDAKNEDGSYYHDDPIHIHHEPSWKWRDDRYKHINFTVQRHHALMPLEDDFHCAPGANASSPLCEHTVSLDSPAWRNDTLIYSNGDGMSVYIGDTSFAFANYSYAFNITAWNVDGEAAYSEVNTTYAELVPYEPVYDMVYSYPVLADGQEYAFDDRRGIITKYGGSLQDGLLHEGRRSYVNWWNASGGGHTPFSYDEFDRPHVMSDGRSAPPTADPVVLEYEGGSQSAMFTNAGYGVIYMDWPVSDYVFARAPGYNTSESMIVLQGVPEIMEGMIPAREQQANQTVRVNASSTEGRPDLLESVPLDKRGAKYENVTAHAGFHSVGFAGHDDVELFEDAMRYPEVPFTKRLTVSSIDQSGNPRASDTVAVRAVPYDGIDADRKRAVLDWWTGGGKDAWEAIEERTGGSAYMYEYTLDGINRTLHYKVNQTMQELANSTLFTEVRPENMTQYMHDKILHDTGGDHIIMQSVINDTYSMEQEWVGYGGRVEADMMRTSLYFGDAAEQELMEAFMLEQGVRVDAGQPQQADAGRGGPPRSIFQPIEDFFYGSRDAVAGFRLSAPLDVGLSMPSPTSIYISINGGPEWELHRQYYAFGGSEDIEINAGRDNVLEVRRSAGGTSAVVVKPDNFGAITTLSINGLPTPYKCATGCVLSGLHRTLALNITAYNEWGGEAHAFVNATVQEARPVAEDPDWRVFAAAAAVLLLAWYVLRKYFKR